MQLQDTPLRLSSAFQPAADGRLEVTNKFVLEFLRHFIGPHQTDCDQFLHFAEFAFISRPHSAIDISPFEADLGYQPRSVLNLAFTTPGSSYSGATSFVERQQAFLVEAQDAMAAAQQCLGAVFDRHRRHQSFAVGDKVLFDSKNMGLSHVGTTGRCKLATRFLGPYTVEAVLGPSRYRLTLPPGLRLFPEFHISLLKPYQRDENPRRVNHVSRVIVADGEEGLLVHSITGHRHRHGSQQYRVRWMDSTVKPSWEPLDNLNQIRGLIHEYLASLPSMRTTARLQEGL